VIHFDEIVLVLFELFDLRFLIGFDLLEGTFFLFQFSLLFLLYSELVLNGDDSFQCFVVFNLILKFLNFVLLDHYLFVDLIELPL